VFFLLRCFGDQDRASSKGWCVQWEPNHCASSNGWCVPWGANPPGEQPPPSPSPAHASLPRRVTPIPTSVTIVPMDTRTVGRKVALVAGVCAVAICLLGPLVVYRFPRWVSSVGREAEFQEIAVTWTRKAKIDLGVNPTMTAVSAWLSENGFEVVATGYTRTDSEDHAKMDDGLLLFGCRKIQADHPTDKDSWLHLKFHFARDEVFKNVTWSCESDSLCRGHAK
jgi:hypothetical protein